MKKLMATLALAGALSHGGCATQFETDRDRVMVGGLLVFAVVSNKTTKAAIETKDDAGEKGEEEDNQ